MSLPSFPSSSRLIGYQEFATVASPKTQVSVDASTEQPTDLQTISPNTSTVDGPTYPLNVYAPLVPNPAPLTEVTVLSCFPLVLKNCKPLTTPEKDARLGPWVRVDRPLDPDTAESRSHETDNWIGGGLGDWWNSFMGSFEAKYLFYRRSRRSDVPRVVDLRLVETGSDNRPVGGDFVGWHRVKVDLKSSFFHILEKTASMHLYFKTVGGTSEDKIGAEIYAAGDEAPETSDEGLEAITELDVTVSGHAKVKVLVLIISFSQYGPGPVWPGFEALGMVTKAVPNLARAKVTLSIRRKPIHLPEISVTPLFKSDGTFKILQIADIHFGVRHEVCREVDWENATNPCVGDTNSTQMIERWLDKEKPDLVVFSGDQLNGQKSSWDEKSVMPKYLTPIINRKIAWASIMGNQ